MRMHAAWVLAGLVHCRSNAKFANLSKRKQGLVPDNEGPWQQGIPHVPSSGPSAGIPGDVCGFVRWASSQASISNEAKAAYNRLVETQPQRVAACNSMAGDQVRVIIDDRGAWGGDASPPGTAVGSSAAGGACSHNPLLNMGIDSAFFRGSSNSRQCSAASNRTVSKIPAASVVPARGSASEADCVSAACQSASAGDDGGDRDAPLVPLPQSTVTAAPLVKTVVVTTPTTISQVLTVTRTVAAAPAVQHVPEQILLSVARPELRPEAMHSGHSAARGRSRRRKSARGSGEDADGVQRELIAILKALIAQQEEASSIKDAILARQNAQKEEQPRTITITRRKSAATHTVTVTSPGAPSSVPHDSTAFAGGLGSPAGAQPARTVTVTKILENAAAAPSRTAADAAHGPESAAAGKQTLQGLLQLLGDVIGSQRVQAPHKTDGKPACSSLRTSAPGDRSVPEPGSSQHASPAAAPRQPGGTSTIDDVISEIIAQPADDAASDARAPPPSGSQAGSRGGGALEDRSVLLASPDAEDGADDAEALNGRPLWSGMLGILRGRGKTKRQASSPGGNSGEETSKLLWSSKKNGSASENDSTKRLIAQLTDFINKDEKSQQDIINMLQAIQAAKRSLNAEATVSAGPAATPETKSAPVTSRSAVASAHGTDRAEEKRWKTVTMMLENEGIINDYKRLIGEKEREIQQLRSERGEKAGPGGAQTREPAASAGSTESASHDAIASTSFRVAYGTPQASTTDSMSAAATSSAIPLSSAASVIASAAKSTVVVTLTRTVTQAAPSRVSSFAARTASGRPPSSLPKSPARHTRPLESVSASSVTIISPTNRDAGPAASSKAQTVSAARDIRPAVATAALEKSPGKRLQSAQLKLQDTRGGHPEIIEVNLPIGEIQKMLDQDKGKGPI